MHRGTNRAQPQFQHGQRRPDQALQNSGKHVPDRQHLKR